MDTHDLYGLPLDRFIPERTALAKQLRADKRRDDAAEIAALRKPSVAAWVVNQLVRAEPEAIDALFAAGDRLRAAQERMLAGELQPAELRVALEHERHAIEGLLAKAEQDGMGATVRDRVSATLHAAALDDDARRKVKVGQLVQELQHVGFGGGSASTASAPAAVLDTTAAPATAERAPKPANAATGSEDARTRAQEARTRAAAERKAQERAAEQAAKQAQERAAARRVERDARAAAQAAERSLATAEERQMAARAALDDAEAGLGHARAEAKRAAAALRVAEERLSRTEAGGRAG